MGPCPGSLEDPGPCLGTPWGSHLPGFSLKPCPIPNLQEDFRCFLGLALPSTVPG